MSGRGDIYQITQAENVNKEKWIVSKFSPAQKKEIEDGVDNRLLRWNEILQQNRYLDQERKHDLFKSPFADKSQQNTVDNDHTIDDDKKRGMMMKQADEDGDGNLEIHEYNKYKDEIAQVFLMSEQDKKNPLFQLKPSQYGYYDDIEKNWWLHNNQENIFLNEVKDETAQMKDSIVSTNSRDMPSGNARNSVVAGNSVDILATNEKTPEEYATSDPYGYAQEYIRQQNIARWIMV